MGMSGDTALVLAKNYVKKTLQGQGALKGQDGFSPIIEENADNTDKVYKLDITTADSAFTTPNLRGKDGECSGGGEANVIESISVNGTHISVDENKNVDITVPSIDGLAKTEDIPTTLPANGGNADTVNNHTVETDVPTDAVFTDTTYSDATQMEHGLMSVDDKKKLDGLTKYTPDGTTITADEDGTLHGVAEVTVDDTLSSTSTNPVQNKVVTSNLTDLKKETTVNLLKPTLKTSTFNGITCTDNGDGTYTLNGNATANTNFDLLNNFDFSGKLKLVGCPNGGSLSTYRVCYTSNVDNVYNDIGDGIIIEHFSSETYPNAKFILFVTSGVTLNNIVFKPMITTNLNATYDDFVPYTGDGETLASDVAEIKNDLGGLSFSASGTTLTITDGTNTWTLEAN